MQKSTVFALFLILLLAVILGVVLVGQGRASAKYQSELEALHLETAAKMQTIKIGFWGGLAAVLLLGTVGITVGLVRFVWQRSRLIHPHANGLFPVIQGRVGRQTYYHDPNRQLSGSVAYSADPEGEIARPILPPNDQGEQLQVTSQAQATQLVAAAGQGRGLTAQSRQLVERVAPSTASRPIPRLPQVVALDVDVPEERHLITALRADWDE